METPQEIAAQCAFGARQKSHPVDGQGGLVLLNDVISGQVQLNFPTRRILSPSGSRWQRTWILFLYHLGISKHGDIFAVILEDDTSYTSSPAAHRPLLTNGFVPTSGILSCSVFWFGMDTSRIVFIHIPPGSRSNMMQINGGTVFSGFRFRLICPEFEYQSEGSMIYYLDTVLLF